MAQKKRKGFGVSDLLRNATGGTDERSATDSPSAKKQPPKTTLIAQPDLEPPRRKPLPAAPPDETPTDSADPAKPEPSREAPDVGAGGGHRKTTKGYVKSDGSRRKRKSLFLEAPQINALEFLAMKHGYQNNVSAFIADELNLDAVADELGFTS